MTEEINVPLMMRQARKAVAQENYVEAERLYALVLQDPEMMGLIDIQTRYAFCVEKGGNIAKATDLYQKIVCLYQDSGEGGAAKALELKINILSQMEQTECEASHFSATLEDALKVGENQPVVSEDDISPLDEMDFLSLGTQDLTGFDESEVTQKLPVMEDIVESSVSCNEGVCVDVALVGIEDEVSEPSPDKAATDAVVSVTQPQGKSDLEGKDSDLEGKDESLHVLRDLIRKGIHKNVVRKGDGKDVEISFTDIGEHALELLEEHGASLDTQRPLMEKGVKKTAAELFGADGMNKQDSDKDLK